MPFDLSETINYFADKALEMPAPRWIASNPIYTAMLLTVCVIIIVMIVYRDVDTEESALTLAIRSSLYVFVLTTTIIFLYSKMLLSGRVSEIGGGFAPVSIDLAGL